MRSLVLSDLHSNLEALQATLGYARGLRPDRVVVLGDIVGYGPDPNAVIELLRARSDVVAIRGNHDRVSAGLGEADDFNAVARAAAEWTRAALAPANLEYLRSLPAGPRALAPGRLLAHGSPADEDEYLLDESGARRAFDAAAFDLCFFGHTHYPCCFVERESRIVLQVARGSDHVTFRIESGTRALVNPGSLGQPRDRNPRCSFALYDDEAGEVTVHRIEYPLEVTREKILAAGLPRMLADRLRLGV